MVDFKELIIPFLIGGIIVASIKFAAISLNNPKLAAIFAVPIGLFSIYFLEKDEHVKQYVGSYFSVIITTLIAIIFFYFLYTKTNISKNLVLLLSILVWIVLAVGKYFLF